MKKTKKESLFTVGGFITETGGTQKRFTKTIRAFNPAHAQEKTKMAFGSKNKIARRNIQIERTQPASEEKK